MKKIKIMLMSGLIMLFIVCLFVAASSSTKIKALSEEKQNQSEVIHNRSNFSDSTVPGIPLDDLFQIPMGANSKVVDNKVVITEKTINQKGSIFSVEDMRLNLTKQFSAEMFLKIDGDADGVTFVVHNDPSATKTFDKVNGMSLGVYPSSISKTSSGYKLYKSMKKSLAIEFDTYNKTGDLFDWNINKNNGFGHVAYTFPDKGDEYTLGYWGSIQGINHHGLQYPTFKLGDNIWRKFTITWSPFDEAGNGQLKYQLEGLDAVIATVPRSTFDTDLVYWGFTGSTGAETEKATVSFASVPALVYYDDTLSLLSPAGEVMNADSAVSNGSELTVQYTGEYTGGLRDLFQPVLTFGLTSGQVYQEGSFLVNGERITPIISGNSLAVNLADLSLENKDVQVSFKLKNEGFQSLSKPSVTSNLSGSNYIQIEGSSVSYTIDAAPPSGVGKLTVVDQGDAPKILETIDYKQFLSSLSDDYSSVEGIEVTLKSDQDIESEVEQLGPANFELTAKDEAGNEATIKVPIFVKEKKEQVVTDGTLLLKGNHFSMKKKDYPKTQNELNTIILNKSALELWMFDRSGNYEKLDANMILVNTTQLPTPGIIPESKVYSIVVATSNSKLVLNLEMEINDASIRILFLNEAGKQLRESIELMGNVGEIKDLTKEASVQKAIQKIKEKHYELVESPSAESSIPIEIDGVSVYYKFKGQLFIESFPANLNFGDTYLTRPFIKEEQPVYDSPLVIGDTRNSKTPWTLTATLEQPLTSEENPSEVLSRAIWYKVNDSTKVPLYKGEAQPIEVGTVSGSGEYNISQGWDLNHTGIQLNVFSNEIVQKGKYKAAILWQVAVTP
ncbi:L-type lectin-domain containing protein [Enterococcus rotai]|uniref:L-type lectin-domain containing protein n=1 Tax=Enterococcus rotai TaxID=118060 RepID=UPI0032B5F234